MRLLSRLEAKQKSGAIRYLLFRQSPKKVILNEARKSEPTSARNKERTDVIARLSDKELARDAPRSGLTQKVSLTKLRFPK